MSHNKVGPLASLNTGGRDGGEILGPSFIPMLIIEADSVKWLHCHGNSLLRLHELLHNELLGNVLLANVLLGSLLGGEKLGSHGSHLRSAVLQEHLTKKTLIKDNKYDTRTIVARQQKHRAGTGISRN